MKPAIYPLPFSKVNLTYFRHNKSLTISFSHTFFQGYLFAAMDRNDDYGSIEAVHEEAEQQSQHSEEEIHPNIIFNSHSHASAMQKEDMGSNSAGEKVYEMKTEKTTKVKIDLEFDVITHCNDKLYSICKKKDMSKGKGPNEIMIPYTELEVDEKDGGTEYDGLWKQMEYKVIICRRRYQRCDGSIYTKEEKRREFVRKLPKPSYPTIPFDCVVKGVYTDKYHSKHNYYNDVPLSKGDRIPKQLDQGHGWVFYIGYSFPTWDVNRTGPDRTTYYSSWDGTKIMTDKGPITLTW